VFVCCAFAVFLLHQLLLPLAVARRRLTGAATPLPTANDAVLWRPGDTPGRGRQKSKAAGLALLLSFELLAGGTALAAGLVAARSLAARPAPFVAALYGPICGALRINAP
jgi:hypothetical protein